MILLALGILTLFAGLALWPALSARARWMAATDALTVVMVAGLVLLHVVPHALEDVGAWALLTLGLGLMAPTLVERAQRARQGRGQAWAWLLGVIIMAGVALHSAIDGMALAQALDPHAHAGHSHGHGSSLAMSLAVILHRLPAGLALGWLIGAPRGMRWAVAAALGMAAATTLGWAAHQLHWMDHHHAGHGGGHASALFEALVAGSLLHLVLGHQMPAAPCERTTLRTLARWRWAGATLGALALLAMTASHALLEQADLALLDGLPALAVLPLLLGAVAWRARAQGHGVHTHVLTPSSRPPHAP